MQLSKIEFVADWQRVMGSDTALSTDTVLEYINLRAQADARPVNAMLKLAHDAFSDYMDTGGGSPVAQAKFMNRMREFNLLYNTHPEASAPGLSDERAEPVAWVDPLDLQEGREQFMACSAQHERLNSNLRFKVPLFTRASAATVAEPSVEAWKNERCYYGVCDEEEAHDARCTAWKEAAQQQAEPKRNWPEDAAHENGSYECRCNSCGNTFVGHKRRVTCKLCTNASQQAEQGADEPSVVRAALIGLANHVRAVPAYSKLLGDMESVDKAIVLLAAQSGQRAGVAEDDVLTRWVFEHRVDDGVCVVKSPSGSRFVSHPGTPVHELVTALMSELSAAAPTQQQEGGK